MMSLQYGIEMKEWLIHEIEIAKRNGKDYLLVDENCLSREDVNVIRAAGYYVGYRSSHMSYIIKW